MPVEGASGAHDWAGFIPFEQLPQAFNPPGGHLASANNKIVPDDYPFLITHDWDSPYRIERIEASLAATQQQSMASSAQLQSDIVSLAAKELLPSMLAAAPLDARQRVAFTLLREWDDHMDADRPEPLIFSAWVRALNRRLFQPRLGTIYGRSWLPSARATRNMLQDDAGWCGKDGCPRLLADALNDALDDLSRRYGGTLEKWRWGDAHRVSFKHPIFSHIVGLSALFDRHPRVGGAADTVNAGSFDAAQEEAPFADLHGPGLRAIYDLADPDNSMFQLALGQSAHLLSPHYDDLEELWLRNQGLRIGREPAVDILTLMP
jgi:penicillin amidase